MHITELLSDGAVSSRLQDTKAASEVRALDSFYQMLQQDANRAVYGWVSNYCTIIRHKMPMPFGKILIAVVQSVGLLYWF